MDNYANCLNILTQNIRSISANITGFKALLSRTKLTQDIIVLTECWLSCNPIIPVINGYDHYFSSISINKNDGIVVYIKSDILDVTVSEPGVLDANCMLIKIGKETCILAIYRTPSIRNITNFLNSLDFVLTNNSSYKNIIIIGDINIDIVEGNIDDKATDYLNLMACHGLLPAHNLPTHGKTSLDHIILKTKLEATTLVIESTVTDHSAVMLALSNISTFKVLSSTRKVDFTELDKYINNFNFHTKALTQMLLLSTSLIRYLEQFVCVLQRVSYHTV